MHVMEPGPTQATVMQTVWRGKYELMVTMQGAEPLRKWYRKKYLTFPAIFVGVNRPRIDVHNMYLNHSTWLNFLNSTHSQLSSVPHTIIHSGWRYTLTRCNYLLLPAVHRFIDPHTSSTTIIKFKDCAQCLCTIWKKRRMYSRDNLYLYCLAQRYTECIQIHKNSSDYVSYRGLRWVKLAGLVGRAFCTAMQAAMIGSPTVTHYRSGVVVRQKLSWWGVKTCFAKHAVQYQSKNAIPVLQAIHISSLLYCHDTVLSSFHSLSHYKR